MSKYTALLSWLILLHVPAVKAMIPVGDEDKASPQTQFKKPSPDDKERVKKTAVETLAGTDLHPDVRRKLEAFDRNNVLLASASSLMTEQQKEEAEKIQLCLILQAMTLDIQTRAKNK